MSAAKVNEREHLFRNDAEYVSKLNDRLRGR